MTLLQFIAWAAFGLLGSVLLIGFAALGTRINLKGFAAVTGAVWLLWLVAVGVSHLFLVAYP